MAPRSDLHPILLAITPNVYFQPPADISMSYPCIVYNRNEIATRYADNSSYFGMVGYEVTVIDRDPDSTIPGEVRMLPFCSYDRGFSTDNLNHDVFTLFF